MIETGYCVYDKTNGKMVGIAGINLNMAKNSRTKYQSEQRSNQYEIRPLFLGSPISNDVLPPITLSKGGVA